jgi:hypothetical protein
MKHNKYKNVGVLYEALCHSVLAETAENNTAKAKQYMKIINKYFVSEGVIQKAWNVYSQLLYNEATNYFYADRFLKLLVSESKKINNRELDSELKKLYQEVDSFSNRKELMKVSTPNYRLFASFNIMTENQKISPFNKLSCEKELMEHIVNNKEATKIREAQKVYNIGDQTDDLQVRMIADTLAIKSFEQKYAHSLNEDQQQCLIKYITAPNNKIFYRWVEKKIKGVIHNIENTNTTTLTEDSRDKLYLVSEKLKNYLNNKEIKEEDLTTVLLSFKLKDSLNLF